MSSSSPAFQSVMFSSYKLGSLVLKNRIVMPPLTRGRCLNGIPTELTAKYYGQRTSAGLIIAEATHISQEACGWNHAPGLYNQEQVQGWKLVVDKIHENGGIVFCQLWHMGRRAHSSFFNIQPVAPSAIAASIPYLYAKGGVKAPAETPRALDSAEIPRLVDDYVKAAKNALAAGFDGIEIHSANGYLLDTFLQSRTNHRTDEFGGSLENRTRLHRLIIEALSNVFPPERIGIRLSPNGPNGDMGSEDNHETFNYMINLVEQYKLGYLHLMDGLGYGFHQRCPQYRLYDARKLYSGLLIGNCGYSKETAEGALNTGVVDAIAFGRPYLSNPDLALRFQHNLPLNPPATPETYYNLTGKPEDFEAGYIDFPMHNV